LAIIDFSNVTVSLDTKTWFFSLKPADLAKGHVTTHTSTTFDYNYASGPVTASFELKGSGLKYNALNIPTKGLVTSGSGSVTGAGSFEFSGVSADIAKLFATQGDAAKVEAYMSDLLKGDDSINGGSGKDHIRSFDGNDTVHGNGGNDYLYGRSGNDKLYGGTGDDYLDGGKGTDYLKGNSGNDHFQFTAELSTNSFDHIVDFRHGHDKIDLSDAVFINLGSSVASNEFVVRASDHKAQSSHQHIIYNQKDGSLWYDQDGSGKSHDAIKFAVLDNHADLVDSHGKTTVDFHDFAIV
jgi:Ca2+-binding RTX toxin-like protein